MRNIDQWLADYGEHHRNHTNKTLHWLGIPIIVFSLMGMLYLIPLPCALSCRGITVALLVTLLGVFLLGWVIQFVGHKIEGQKPSFFEDLQFLLIGPLWLLSDVYGRLGISY